MKRQTDLLFFLRKKKNKQKKNGPENRLTGGKIVVIFPLFKLTRGAN